MLTGIASGITIGAAGCSTQASTENEPESVDYLYEAAPEEPIIFSAQFARTDAENADLRVRFEFDTIPTVEHGVIRVKLEPESDYTRVADQDTVRIVDTSGFQKHNGKWVADEPTTDLWAEVELQLGDNWHNIWHSNERRTYVSYRYHIGGLVDIVSAIYLGITDIQEIPVNPDNAEVTSSIERRASIHLEQPAYSDSLGGIRGGGFAVFGEFGRTCLVNNGFSATAVNVSGEELYVNSEVLLNRIDKVRQLLRLGGDVQTVAVWIVKDSALDARGKAFPDDKVRRFKVINMSESVWFHEYIHLEQQFELKGDMHWFREASADYFSLFSQFLLGNVSFDQFYEEYKSYDDDYVLAELDSPTHASAYAGDAVLAALDAEIRERSGDRTLATVFRAMNDYGEPIGHKAFSDIVADAAGERVDDWLGANVLSSPDTSIPKDQSLFSDRGRFNIPATDNLSTGQLRCDIRDIP